MELGVGRIWTLRRTLGAGLPRSPQKDVQGTLPQKHGSGRLFEVSPNVCRVPSLPPQKKTPVGAAGGKMNFLLEGASVSCRMFSFLKRPPNVRSHVECWEGTVLLEVACFGKPKSRLRAKGHQMGTTDLELTPRSSDDRGSGREGSRSRAATT